MADTQPTYLGFHIAENLWPLGQKVVLALPDGNPVEGELFVKPNDGTVVFRQVEAKEVPQ